MADKKISQLDTATSAASGDYAPIVSDPGGTPVTKKITISNFATSIAALITSIASLTVATSLYLSSQPAGRIVYTESNGAATTTPNLLYGTSTQVLSVRSIINSGSSTISGLNFTNATGTNVTSTNVAATTIFATTVTSTGIRIGNGSSACTAGGGIVWSDDSGANSCLYSAGNGSFDFSVNGTNMFTVNTNGTFFRSSFFAITNNSVDFGQLGLGLRDFYVSRNFIFGSKNVASKMYVGTTDGCGVWTFSASNTTPTLTPTSTANCN